jgi:hypothetical protein
MSSPLSRSAYRLDTLAEEEGTVVNTGSTVDEGATVSETVISFRDSAGFSIALTPRA